MIAARNVETLVKVKPVIRKIINAQSESPRYKFTCLGSWYAIFLEKIPEEITSIVKRK